MTVILKAPAQWVNRPIKVAVIGAGGNGAEAIDCLAMFHTANLAMGGAGLMVTAFDPSEVREVNLVRQRFWMSDLGCNKAICLISRYNLMLGTQWDAEPCAFDCEQDDDVTDYDIIITACDLPSVRAQISKQPIGRFNHVFWLDLGNMSHHGQAILGKLGEEHVKYPHAVDHYPQIRTMEDDNTKSCSAAESLHTQSMLMNRFVTTAAMPMIWDLIHKGETDRNAVYVSVKTLSVGSEGFPELEVV